jgi:hypothetical protein
MYSRKKIPRDLHLTTLGRVHVSDGI